MWLLAGHSVLPLQQSQEPRGQWRGPRHAEPRQTHGCASGHEPLIDKAARWPYNPSERHVTLSENQKSHEGLNLPSANIKGSY